MDQIPSDIRARLDRLCKRLDKQVETATRLDAYLDGNPPVPPPVRQAKATKAFALLMGLSQTNWAKLIVDSVDERLEVQGIRFGDSTADTDAWEIWQRNQLDADSGLTHAAALSAGRAFAIVWPDADGKAKITPEHASTTVVEYEPGSRTKRSAALRRWVDGDDKWYATLYLADQIYKFESPASTTGAPAASEWVIRQPSGEEWPLPNPLPLKVVPVIEIAVNRKLRSGVFSTAAGEFEDSTGHIDRINYTVFSWIVAMTWSGFPMRAVIGDPILRDDEGNPLAPFDVVNDRIVQLENPDAKLIQLPEAELKNYIATAEAHIRHLAAITKTPPHYLLGELVNLSADAIRAAEAGLVSKVRRHQRTLGERWEEILRLAFLIENPDDERANEITAEIIWKDPESRSQAERADAAVKLKDILPWQAIAERILGATPQEISRWESQRSSDNLGALLGQQPPATP